MNRQLKTIEKLLKEKEELNNKCLEMGKEVKTIDDKYAKKVTVNDMCFTELTGGCRVIRSQSLKKNIRMRLSDRRSRGMLERR